LGVTLVGLTLLLQLSQAEAQQVDCNAVLIPGEQGSTSDVRSVYSYMAMYAQREYERLHTMNQQQRDVEGTYKAFGAEYHDATSASDFAERVKQKIDQQAIFSNASEMRTAFKIELSDRQIDAWSRCAQTGGGLLLEARHVTPKGFILRVSSRPTRGSPSQVVEIKAVNGLLDGQPVTSAEYVGVRDKSYLVTPQSDASAAVLIYANAGPFTNDVAVNLQPKKPTASRGPRPHADRTLLISRNFRVAGSPTQFSAEPPVKTVVQRGRAYEFDSRNADGCAMKVSVDGEGFYTVFAKTRHDGGEWITGPRLDMGQADLSLNSCFVRAEPADEDALLRWNRGQAN
jgi:hypothetical protein